MLQTVTATLPPLSFSAVLFSVSNLSCHVSPSMCPLLSMPTSCSLFCSPIPFRLPHSPHFSTSSGLLLYLPPHFLYLFLFPIVRTCLLVLIEIYVFFLHPSGCPS